MQAFAYRPNSEQTGLDGWAISCGHLLVLATKTQSQFNRRTTNAGQQNRADTGLLHLIPMST